MSVTRMLENLFKSKKGLSNIIGSVVMILLAVISVIIVGSFVTNLVQNKIDKSGNCLDTVDQILIKDSQTCYSPSLNELKVFVEIKDIDVSEIIIAISDENSAIPFTIKSETSEIPSVKNYLHQNEITLPSKKSGLAYYFNITELGMSKPTIVKVVPVINKNPCPETDQISSIPLC